MRISNLKSQISGSRGFTLIEILAAVTVLALLMVIFTQVVGMVSDTWKKGKARIDNFSQARVALGLMDRDIQAMVLRRDVAAFVGPGRDGGGNSQAACAFYTRIPGSETAWDRRLSLVQYEIADPATLPRLTRKDYGLDLGTGGSPRTMQLNETGMLPDLALAQVQVQDVADGIIGFEFQFVDGNGTFQDRFIYDHDHPGALANTRAVTISLAVMDADNYKFAVKTGHLAELLEALKGDPGLGESYAEFWRNKIDSPGFIPALPQAMRGALKIFERSVYIPLQMAGS